MRKVYIGVITFFISLGIVFTVALFSFIKPGTSALYIDSTPVATIYVNGKSVGTTPYSGVFRTDAVVVSLLPQSSDSSPLSAFQTAITLTPGVRSVLRHDFSAIPGGESGDEISFEKNPLSSASLSIISQPPHSLVYLDRSYIGTTPFYIESAPEGDHILTFTSAGYVSRDVKISVIHGYTLTANVSLGKSDTSFVQQTPLPSSPAVVLPGEMVRMNASLGTSIPVRMAPQADAAIIGHALSQKTYKLVQIDETNLWYKIFYESNLSGWVPSTTAQVVEPKQ